MNKKLVPAVLRLLRYSWKDIDFQYEQLTVAEQKLISKDEFKQLCKLMGEPKENGHEPGCECADCIDRYKATQYGY